ncbi:hypothetical protein CLTEP_21200 [Clostridium tepidiprofundi DSM 19306]|uniref:Uncharacterized protein n=1 Tax=Clostridium tepidiprofundi DSM 19306 TaxID=1121338 RepID=A0A151B242_9CLOT|nr:hypothetical protein [Clostridium tepidiprofundi]KYH33946.1 hypothetical protein CLTEP_21200 [Clostridium tepidiprofundi DSM 19306]
MNKIFKKSILTLGLSLITFTSTGNVVTFAQVSKFHKKVITSKQVYICMMCEDDSGSGNTYNPYTGRGTTSGGKDFYIDKRDKEKNEVIYKHEDKYSGKTEIKGGKITIKRKSKTTKTETETIIETEYMITP